MLLPNGLLIHRPAVLILTPAVPPQRSVRSLVYFSQFAAYFGIRSVVLVPIQRRYSLRDALGIAPCAVFEVPKGRLGC